MQAIRHYKTDRFTLLLENNFMAVEVTKVIKNSVVLKRLPLLDRVNVKCWQARSLSKG